MRPKIDPETVERLMQQAELSMTEKELERVPADLEACLSMMDQLAKLDTKDCELYDAITAKENVLRRDEPAGDTEAGSLLACAKTLHDGMYAVPRSVGETGGENGTEK